MDSIQTSVIAKRVTLASHHISDGGSNSNVHVYETVSQYERVPGCDVEQSLRKESFKEKSLGQTSVAHGSLRQQCQSNENDNQEKVKQNPTYDQVQTYQRIGHCDFSLQTLPTISSSHKQIQSPIEIESALQSYDGNKSYCMKCSDAYVHKLNKQ